MHAASGACSRHSDNRKTELFIWQKPSCLVSGFMHLTPSWDKFVRGALQRSPNLNWEHSLSFSIPTILITFPKEGTGNESDQTEPHWSMIGLQVIYTKLSLSRIAYNCRVSPFIGPKAIIWWWATIRAKQLSMATNAWVIWLCACVKYWPGRGLVYVRPLF